MSPSPPPTAPQAPQVAPRAVDRRVRWGFLTAARIANKWAHALNLLPSEAELVAVASRDRAKAEAFATEHAVAEVADSYEALVARDDVDVIYVASPHTLHLEHALMAIEAGKSVLVEKPATISLAQTTALVEAAAARGVFFMEAMWTRCNPLIIEAAQLVRRGVLGEPRLLTAAFPVRFVAPDDHRIFATELAGGAILDLGVYPAHVIHALLGRPDVVTARGMLTHTGVDDTSVATLQWHDGEHRAMGTITTTLDGQGAQRLELVGTQGSLVIDDFVKPERMRLVPHTGEAQDFVTSFPPGGYTFQAQEVHRCLRLGHTQSDLVPWQSSLDVASMLDDWLAGVHATPHTPAVPTLQEDR